MEANFNAPHFIPIATHRQLALPYFLCNPIKVMRERRDIRARAFDNATEMLGMDLNRLMVDAESFDEALPSF